MVIVFFFAGKQSGYSDANFWVLLKDLASISGSVAAIVTVIIAIGAYDVWKKQITQPHQYQNEVQVFRNLTTIHLEVNQFAIESAYDLERHLEIGINEMEEGFEVTVTPELKSIRNIYFHGVFKDMRGRFVVSVQGPSLSEFAAIADVPKVILDYRKSLYEYIKYVGIAVSVLSKAPFRLDFPDGKYSVGDLKDEGVLFLNLERSYEEVRKYYNSKWT